MRSWIGRDPSIFFFWEVFCPSPFPKNKEFCHVPDTSGICPGCPEGLSIGYLRLSADNISESPETVLGPTRPGVRSGPGRCGHLGPDRTDGSDIPTTFQPYSLVCVLLCFILPILGDCYGPIVIPLEGTWGCRMLTLHLKYVAGYTGPLLFLFERTQHLLRW